MGEDESQRQQDIKIAETIGKLSANMEWVVSTLKELKADMKNSYCTKEEHRALVGRVATLEGKPHKRFGYIIGTVGAVTGVISVIIMTLSLLHVW